MSKRILITLMAVALMGLIVFMNNTSLKMPYGVKINHSDSLPYWAFISSKELINPIQRGIFVSFCIRETNTKLAKRVVGISGDTVTVESGSVYINNQLIGPVYSATPSGAALTPIAGGKIPEGYVFIGGDHPQSFDSRYAEVGLLPITEIEDVLWPLF